MGSMATSANDPEGRATSGAVTAQIVTLSLCGLAAAYGIVCLKGVLAQGSCVDSTGPSLGVLEAWIVDLPVGVLGVLAGVLVKKGSPFLRKTSIVVSLLTILIPIAASLAFQQWRCS